MIYSRRGFDTRSFWLTSILLVGFAFSQSGFAAVRSLPAESWVSAVERLSVLSEPVDPNSAERIRLTQRLGEWETSVTRFTATQVRPLLPTERTSFFERLWAMRSSTNIDVAHFTITGLGILLSGYNRGDFAVPDGVLEFFQEDLPTSMLDFGVLQPIVRKAFERIRHVNVPPRPRTVEMGMDAREFLRGLQSLSGAWSDEIYQALDTEAAMGRPLAAEDGRGRLALESSYRKFFAHSNARIVKLAIEGAGLLLDVRVMGGERPNKEMLSALTRITERGPEETFQRVLTDVNKARVQADVMLEALRRSYKLLDSSGIHHLADGQVLAELGEKIGPAESHLAELDALLERVPMIQMSAVEMIKTAAQLALERIGAGKAAATSPRSAARAPVPFDAESVFLAIATGSVAERLDGLSALKGALADSNEAIGQSADFGFYEDTIVKALRGENLEPNQVSQAEQIQIAMLEALKRIPVRKGKSYVPSWLRGSEAIQTAIAELLLHPNEDLRKLAADILQIPMTPEIESPGVNHLAFERFFVTNLTTGKVETKKRLLRGIAATIRNTPTVLVPDWLVRSDAIQLAVTLNLMESRELRFLASRVLILIPGSKLTKSPSLVSHLHDFIADKNSSIQSFFTALHVLRKLPEADERTESQLVAIVIDRNVSPMKRSLAGEFLGEVGITTQEHFRWIAAQIPGCQDVALKRNLARTLFRSLPVISGAYDGRGNAEIAKLIMDLLNDPIVGNATKKALNELSSHKTTGAFALAELGDEPTLLHKKSPEEILLEACRLKAGR